MATTPDELRHEIDRTRAELVADANRLVDRTSPKRIVQRRTDRVRAGLTNLRERVMGTAHDTGHQAREAAYQARDTMAHHTGSAKETVAQHAGQAKEAVTSTAAQAADAVTSTAHQAAQAVQQAPQMARQQTRGNPLAAGLIAFGAGLLAASMLPKSRMEEQAVQQLADHASGLVEPVKETAAEVAGRLREDVGGDVQQAVQQVKQTATDAAQTTQEQARDAAGQVTDSARESGKHVKEQART